MWIHFFLRSTVSYLNILQVNEQKGSLLKKLGWSGVSTASSRKEVDKRGYKVNPLMPATLQLPFDIIFLKYIGHFKIPKSMIPINKEFYNLLLNHYWMQESISYTDLCVISHPIVAESSEFMANSCKICILPYQFHEPLKTGSQPTGGSPDPQLENHWSR